MAINTIQQYEVIRNSIKANINTIRILVMQIDSLNALVAEMKDESTKEKFSNNIKELYKSINLLIQETDDLLNESIKFAENINVS